MLKQCMKARVLRGATIFLAGLVMVASAGCVMGREFRSTALPAFHNGISTILTGFVDGVFAAIEPDPELSDPGS